MAGKAMQTLVMVPAMIRLLAARGLHGGDEVGVVPGVDLALARHILAWGALAWISGISGPFGPWGTEAVVMTGSLASVAIEARAAAWRRSVVIGMSCHGLE
jgi:hypothetical protein